jgi:DNA-binding transcriptional MerR regulator
MSVFATATHTTVHALRHYEAMGLLLARRLPNGYRDYTPDQAREAVFIAMSRQVGISLQVIAEHLPKYRVGRLRPADMVAILHERRDALDAQIAELSQQRQTVVEHAQWIEHQARSAHKPWPKTTTSQRKKSATKAGIKRVI